MNILADASLPEITQAFPEPFQLTLYHDADEITGLLPNQDVLFCRSNLKVNQTLLQNYHLSYVATASSGTDHLDHQWLASQNIQIIDAKGSNASAVADYILACLAYLEQKNLVQGKTAGIIGFGNVGSEVNQRLQAVGYNTLISDPLKNRFADFSQADLLCIHAELHDNLPYPSKNLINAPFLAQLKPHCVIINAARGGIINENELLKTDFIYCTDVYLNEPHIDSRIVKKAILCTPHIAGHSLEAKYRAVSMISDALHQIAGYVPPHYTKPKRQQSSNLTKNMSWQEAVLTIYDPSQETLQLKQATDLQSEFLNLRKNHQYRHDFALYGARMRNIFS